MRLRYDPDAEKKLEESQLLIKDFPFLLKKNMVLELGMGKGQMLTKLAFDNKEKIFVGIEKYATVACKALKKAENLKLTNFKIICKDIKNIDEFLKGKVDLIWLTFSDPWPKKRHYKRRLTYVDFLKKYQKIMNKNGVVKLKTDNDVFFNWTLEHLEENNFQIINVTRDLHKSFLNKNNIMTEYEQKWKIKGKNINYLEILINN